MERITRIQKRVGVDVGFNESNLHPANGEGRVGKSGLDKNLPLERILEIASRMDDPPNIIIKAGARAKWYLKRFPLASIESAIEKQTWRNISRSTMWIIEWDQ
jgi:hypothetical protein